jgi:hypothetical protein
MKKGRAILFSRGLVGRYGVGYIGVDHEGITMAWAGWLVRRRPQKFTWSQIDAVTTRGSWIRVVVNGRYGAISAFVFRPDTVLNDLRQLAPKRLDLAG